VRRKSNLEKLFMRTKEQHEKEKQMQAEAKKLEQKIKKEEKEEKNLRKLINAENQVQNQEIAEGEEALGDEPQKGGRRDRGSGVYLRSNRLIAPLPISEKMNKKLEDMLGQWKINGAELKPTAQVVKQYDELRREILHIFSLQKYIKKKQEEKESVAERIQEISSFQKICAPPAQHGSSA